MRVIAGTAGGQRLDAPPGRDVRPTADRVREALFASLAEHVPDARVLDLYAGSGALAAEALSRGATAAVLVEHDPRAAAVARANLERTGLAARAQVVRDRAERFCRAPRGGPFDVVLADPPYAVPLATVYELLTALHTRGALSGAVAAVVERDRRDPDLDRDPPAFLARDRVRSYGDTVLLHLRGADAPERADE